MELILDFDGVICDSRHECMLTSWHAFQIIANGYPIMDYPEIPIPDRLAAVFLEYRYLVLRADGYYFLWEDILAERNPDNAKWEFAANQKKLQSFLDTFFSFRDRWRQSKKHEWLKQNPLYPGFLSLKNTVIDTSDYYIVSAKDESSIASILEYNQLPISSERIYGNSYPSKKTCFAMLKERGISEALFIDDNIANLDVARNAGYSTALARWGYIGPETTRFAEKQGIWIFTLTGFLNHVKSQFPNKQ